jgi:two-component system cell cycle sensor histidine kinase/response regulator CckA
MLWFPAMSPSSMSLPTTMSRPLALLWSLTLLLVCLAPRQLFAGGDEQAPLVVGSSNNFPPVNLLDATGELDGFGRELSTAVLEAAGREVEYRHSSSWTEVLAWLDAGEVDLIHDAAIILERERFLDFSDPILSMPVVLFVQRDRFDIRGLEDLGGHPVACVRAHVSHLWMQRHADSSCRVVDTPIEGLYALLGGEVHAFVYPEQIVRRMAQDLGVDHLVKIEGEPLLEMRWAMAVREGDQATLEPINRGLALVRASGQYERIYDRWFGRGLLSGYTQRELAFAAGGTGLSFLLLGILLGVLARSRRLRRVNRALEEHARERERAARRHREQEEYYLSLLDASSDIIVVVGSDGRFSYVSGAAERLLGFPATSLLGGGITDLLPEEERERCVAAFQQGMAQPGTPIVVAHHARCADGSVKPVESSAQAVFTERGVLLVAAVRDTSEREQAQEAIARSQEQVAQAQKLQAIAQLAGGAAHDFNNLLTVIMAAVDALAAGDEDEEEQAQCVEDIRVAAERASGLTRKLLAFGGRQVLQPRVLELDELVGGMRKLLRRTLRADIRLGLTLQAGGCHVRVDPTQLEQVLVNLVVNARDAMVSGGELNIATGAVEPSDWPAGQGDGTAGVVLEISDTGAGMSPEVRARIFEPFFSTKRALGGIGLGLSTVHGIVKQSGGCIQVDSSPGQGTVFRVFLPLAREAAISAPAQAPLQAPQSGLPRVLLVEDEDRVRERLCSGLMARGFDVATADGGQSALALVGSAAEPFDVLVTDVVMPDLSGPELADLLLERQPGLRVLFISGHADDERFQRRALGPGLAFLAKPFQLDELAQSVLALHDVASQGAREPGPARAG